MARPSTTLKLYAKMFYLKLACAGQLKKLIAAGLLKKLDLARQRVCDFKSL